jgi:UDP-N-acetylmuramate:L-alanyl-gamma-D-glutamyl-meso-diaminopimelate ligase
MGGLALIAREAGFEVSGSDTDVYPPMSTQLKEQGIAVQEGYLPAHLEPAPDQVLVGNALSRGNPAVEFMLDRGLAYTSGPQWLSEQVLTKRFVLAVAGTHGKTTTASLLAWILEEAGLAPGFLIGGMPVNFGLSARLGKAPFFVVEADEYDTAFFDKRSKFIHYRPRTLILNNLEFDHADIFPDLEAIKRQFHHLLRTVPSTGLIVANSADQHVSNAITLGCWTNVEYFNGQSCETKPALWQARNISPEGTRFDVFLGERHTGTVHWPLAGLHNVHNALGAIAAARHAGVPVPQAINSLGRFRGVKRRLELRGESAGVRVFDDFAHHPTAIAATLNALRASAGKGRVLAVLEPRSNTMRMGVHKDTLAASLSAADHVFLYQPTGLPWTLKSVAEALGSRGQVMDSIEGMINELTRVTRPGDHIVIMSNGSFGNIHARLLTALERCKRE